MTTPLPAPLGVHLLLPVTVMQRGNGAFEEIGGRLQAEDFCSPGTSVVFAVISFIYKMGRRITIDEVIKTIETNCRDFTKGHCEPDEVEELTTQVLEWLHSICECDYTTTYSIAELCDLVLQQKTNCTMNEFINQKIGHHDDGGKHLKSAISPIGEAMVEAIDETERERKGEVIRVETGFAGLDECIHGLEFGCLYVLGGEPKTGKSLLVCQVALHLARKRVPVGIISLEMSKKVIARRFLMMLAGGESVRKMEVERLREAQREFGALPLHIIDKAFEIGVLEVFVEALVRMGGVRLVVIDYLHKIRCDKFKTNKTDELNEIIQRIQKLAQNLNVAVLLIAPLTIKAIAYRKFDKKPTASDFKDTGQLPYDADCILFLWRPLKTDEGYRELFVDQSRHTSQGHSIGLQFDAGTLTFTEIQSQEERPQDKNSKPRLTKAHQDFLNKLRKKN
jgi:replicative DNA helicase